MKKEVQIDLEDLVHGLQQFDGYIAELTSQLTSVISYELAVEKLIINTIERMQMQLLALKWDVERKLLNE